MKDLIDVFKKSFFNEDGMFILIVLFALYSIMYTFFEYFSLLSKEIDSNKEE